MAKPENFNYDFNNNVDHGDDGSEWRCRRLRVGRVFIHGSTRNFTLIKTTQANLQRLFEGRVGEWLFILHLHIAMFSSFRTY